ncbi:hypothetical protein LVD15_23345 [Fulvivirga maritima]|uniref:hypothetical protein n=1 Tax=Fulvivirga maritima TaxID=2904247 RepID=UPI001F21D105|nr:hypothetical protein [Fulvivirga maritima]UII26204.1 hypothetical protein LVD15_23345 [Fulvivirga maritima]
MDVYFDDLKVTHTLGNVVAGSDFYPFGLTMEEKTLPVKNLDMATRVILQKKMKRPAGIVLN